MSSPYLNVFETENSLVTQFEGLNRRARIADGEFSGMVNMTSDNYPLLSPRKPRKIAQRRLVKSETVDEETVEVPQNLNGILGDVGFAAVWGTDFYYLGEKVKNFSLADTEKNMVAMGANLLIFPDAVYYNTVDGTHGELDENAKKYIVTLHVQSLKIKGSFRSITTSFSLPVAHSQNVSFNIASKSSNCDSLPSDVDLLSEIRICDCKLYYVYDYEKKEGSVYKNVTWKEIPITGIRFNYADADGNGNGAQGSTLFDEGTLSATFDFSNFWCGNHKIVFKGSGSYRYIDGFSSLKEFGVRSIQEKYNSTTDKHYLRIIFDAKEKNFPLFDHVCALDNRLWGCRYGLQVNSEDDSDVVNEIYCSALGDFKTWTLASSTSTLAGDPWAASVGEYGSWTGCIAHRGYVLFFKENCMIRVSGTKPANFTYKAIATNGVTDAKSMAIIDETLYYKGRNGVYAYNGSLPQRISVKLGDAEYTEGAVGGAMYGKYYINMGRKTYVYDTSAGLWHEEGKEAVRFFARSGSAFYGGIGHDIVCFVGSPAEFFEAEDEETVEWSAETGDIGLSSPYHKFYRGFTVRFDGEIGARFCIDLSVGGGAFNRVADYTVTTMESVDIPVATPRCDRMKIRFSGTGDVKVYSIFYEIEAASTKPERKYS